MTENTQNNKPVLLSLIGGIFILLCALIIGITNAPIAVSTSPRSIENLSTDKAPLWGRIMFGMQDYISDFQPAIGVAMAATIIYCSLILYVKPKREKLLSSLIMVFSAAALLYGGGFIIGSILSFVGSSMIFQTPRKPNETLMGKTFSALRADSKVFEHFTIKPSVEDAAILILFANLLSGIGNAVYGFNVEKILTSASTKIPFEILATGKIYGDLTLVSAPITLMGLGIVKWIILSLVIFLIAVKLFGGKASLSSIATCTGFAYAPISLQIFTPFIFTSKPYLTMWPLAVFALTNLWMIAVLIVGIKHIMNITYSKATATVALCGAIYFLINYLVFMPLSIPHVIKFEVGPQETLLVIVSFFIAVSAFFMRNHTARNQAESN